MKTILIVDDEPNIRKALQRILYHPEINFIESSNGLNALDKIINHQIDLIILDYKMPFVNGIELLKWIHKVYNDMKVIILSGCLSEKNIFDLTEYQDLWTKIYTKPCDENELRTRVYSCLNL